MLKLHSFPLCVIYAHNFGKTPEGVSHELLVIIWHPTLFSFSIFVLRTCPAAAFKWHAIAAKLYHYGLLKASGMPVSGHWCPPDVSLSLLWPVPPMMHEGSPPPVFSLFELQVNLPVLEPWCLYLKCTWTLSGLLVLLCYTLLHKLHLHRLTQNQILLNLFLFYFYLITIPSA